MAKFNNRIKESARTSSVILANDYDSNTPKLEEKTIKNIKTLHEYICALKINFHLLLKLSPKEISRINKIAHDYGLQCIADIKLNDIGNTNLITTKNLWNMNFDAVIVNPIMGPKNLQSLVQSSHKQSKGVISLCHMSAPEARFSYELDVIQGNRKKTPLYQLFLDWAIKNKTDGIIVGATFPNIIKFCRKRAKKNLDIFSPGIGVQGGNAFEAKKLGSDFLIIGRTILNSKNPKKTAKQFALDSII
tara:strand:- start:4694 stop:5434 length:741 start_codon:yes stop_codon:yes gene_type:complete